MRGSWRAGDGLVAVGDEGGGNVQFLAEDCVSARIVIADQHEGSEPVLSLATHFVDFIRLRELDGDVVLRHSLRWVHAHPEVPVVDTILRSFETLLG